MFLLYITNVIHTYEMDPVPSVQCLVEFSESIVCQRENSHNQIKTHNSSTRVKGIQRFVSGGISKFIIINCVCLLVVYVCACVHAYEFCMAAIIFKIVFV